MNHGIQRRLHTDNALQCGFRAIWHDLCVNLSLAFQNTKDDRFAVSTPSSFTTNTLCTKIRFIDFYRTLQERFKFAALSNSLSYFEVNGIDGSNRNIGQLGCTGGCKIQCKTANKLSEFSFSNWRTEIVPVFNIHLSKLTHFSKCLTS